jgi:hypothetical protein
MTVSAPTPPSILSDAGRDGTYRSASFDLARGAFANEQLAKL